MALNFDPNQPGAFLGKGLAWPLREDPETGDFAKAEGEQSIEESLEHLLQISFNEIPGLERMATNADELLFDNDPESARDLFLFSARKTIETYERRIQLIDIVFQLVKDTGSGIKTVASAQAGRIGVRLIVKYRIKATGEATQNIFPFNISINGDLI